MCISDEKRLLFPTSSRRKRKRKNLGLFAATVFSVRDHFSIKKLLLQFEMCRYLTVNRFSLRLCNCQAVCISAHILSYRLRGPVCLLAAFCSAAPLFHHPSCLYSRMMNHIEEPMGWNYPRKKREVVRLHPNRFPGAIYWAAAPVLIDGGTDEEGDAAGQFSSCLKAELQNSIFFCSTYSNILSKRCET